MWVRKYDDSPNMVLDLLKSNFTLYDIFWKKNVQKLVFLQKLWKTNICTIQKTSYMHTSDICTTYLQINNLLSWKIKE